MVEKEGKEIVSRGRNEEYKGQQAGEKVEWLMMGRDSQRGRAGLGSRGRGLGSRLRIDGKEIASTTPTDACLSWLGSLLSREESPLVPPCSSHSILLFHGTAIFPLSRGWMHACMHAWLDGSSADEYARARPFVSPRTYMLLATRRPVQLAGDARLSRRRRDKTTRSAFALAAYLHAGG